MLHEIDVPKRLPAGHYVAGDPVYLLDNGGHEELGGTDWSALLDVLDDYDRRRLYGVPVALADESDVLAVLAVRTEGGDGVFPLRFHHDEYSLPVDSGTLALVRADAADPIALARSLTQGATRDVGELDHAHIAQHVTNAIVIGHAAHPSVHIDGRRSDPA